MASYLLTWNPKRWHWDTLAAESLQTKQGPSEPGRWSCGRTKRIGSGDRLFLLKQGEPPKGIIAKGTAVSSVFEQEHWDGERASNGDTALYVMAIWDAILDPETEAPLPTKGCDLNGFQPVNWNTQGGGISIVNEVADWIEILWNSHVDTIRQTFTVSASNDADPDADAFPEGKQLFRLHRTHERSPLLVQKAKERAIAQSGRLTCAVCDFDFYKRYGAIGEGFIECHHTIPVSELGEAGTTRLCDVALVCPNCHRMLHRKRPWLRIDELKTLLQDVATALQ